MYSHGGTRFVVATIAWLLISLFALGLGIALLAGLASDPSANSSRGAGAAFVLAAIGAVIVYWLMVVRRLGKQ